MTDAITVEYHVEDTLPGGGVVIIEDSGCRIDVYLSRAHGLDVIASVLGPMFTEYLAHIDPVISRLSLVG